MLRKTVSTIKHYVFFFCYFLLFFLHSVFLFAQDNQADTFSFIPSHEAAIRMVAVHNGFLYVLDANGLLTITKTSEVRKSQRMKSSLESYRIVHRKYAIRDASFSYPYIVFTNDADMLYIYNITQRYMVFSASYKRGTSYTFSPSKRLFSYIDETGLVVISTATWAAQHTYVINETPSYIAISKTEKNIMLYVQEGAILYKNIYTGEVLKRISTTDALTHLAMNTTRRFAVGISGNSLSIVDLVNGHAVDTIVISSFPTRIFAQQNSHKIVSLSTFSDNSQMLKLFNFSNNGQLLEEDILNVDNGGTVSTLFAQEKKLYIGFEDGSLSMYDIKDKTLNAILFDKTIANYDIITSQNTIFFANTDGIRSIALSSLVKDSGKKNLTPQFIPQTLVSPLFASSVVLKSLPYIVSRARTISLLFELRKAEDGQIRFLPPIPLSFLPSTVVVNSTSLFAYSQQFAKGSLIHSTAQKTDTSEANTLQQSENFIVNHPSFAFHFDDDSTLFTSAPLNEQADGGNAASNLLYAYRVLEKTFENSEKKSDNSIFVKKYALELPFSMEDTLYIRHIPAQSSRFILVRKVLSQRNNNAIMEFLLVDYVINSKDIGEVTRITVLAREEYDEDSLFLYQVSDDIIKIITIARDTMFFTTSHARTGNAIYHTAIPYPDKISRILRAHITDSLLTAVDVNNIAFTAEISDFFITITSLMVLAETNNGNVHLITERLR